MSALKKKGELRVQYRRISDLKPAKTNARTHSPEQVAQIARLIEEFGWTNPILLDGKDTILAGHGRLMAAKQLGMQSVPTIELGGLTPAQKRAYLIADNRAAEKAGWDRAMLAAEFTALQDMGFDTALTGFNLADLSFNLEPPAHRQAEPPAIDPQKPAVSRLGDVWHLGDHRLACGDNGKPETLNALMDGERAACVFTDPPYGVSYEARSGQFEVIKGDDLRRGQLYDMLVKAFRQAAAHANPNAGWYVWHASNAGREFERALNDTGVICLETLMWVKPGQVLGWSDYRWAHEPCFYAALQGNKPAFYGDRTETTTWRVDARGSAGEASATIGNGVVVSLPNGREIYVTNAPPKGKKVRHIQAKEGQGVLLTTATDADNVWEVSRDSGHGKKDESIHPTQKPVELVRRALRNSTRETEIVVDMFSGSGSTIIGAEQTGRRARAADLDPLYVDASIRRWQNFTGKQATYGGSDKALAGKTFDDATRIRGKKASR